MSKALLRSWLQQRRLWVSLALLIIGLLPAGAALASDPTGAATIDVESDPGGAAVTAVNYVWVLLAAFLVFFMQAGFALMEAGST